MAERVALHYTQPWWSICHNLLLHYRRKNLKRVLPDSYLQNIDGNSIANVAAQAFQTHEALSSAHSTKTPADSSARGRKRCCCLCKLFVYDVCDCTATLLVLLDEMNVAEELLAVESPARGR